MGEQAILHCRSYALEAERKMGEMLLETDRANGGDAQRTRLHRVTESPKTITELGLTKRESAFSDACPIASLARAASRLSIA